jgi:hypothetical protein
MSDATCPACNAPLDAGAAYCARCGAAIAAEPRPVPTQVRKASKWLLALSIIFVLFGTGYGLYVRSQAEKARAVLDDRAESDTLTVEGKTWTVAELRKQIDREVWWMFGANYFLAAVMLGLFFWSRRAPFPAMVTGLCVYLAVIVLNAVIDPKTLYQGILIKALFISAMIAGIKAAMEERDRMGLRRPAS